MQLMSKYNACVRILLCGTDICNGYALIILLKDKKYETIVNEF